MPSGRMQSRFTRHLIEGIETGGADVNGTGAITLDDLFDYVRAALRREGPGQEPKRLNAIDGDMVIARNPVRRAAPLPAALLRRVGSRNWESRASACIALGEIILRGGDDKASALAALRALASDPDDRVKRRAASELAQMGETAEAEAEERPAPIPVAAAAEMPARETPSGDRLSAADADANAAMRAALLMRPPAGDRVSDETDATGATGTGGPAPPKPGLDTVAKVFIGLFVVLLLAMIVVLLNPGDGGPDTTTDPPTEDIMATDTVTGTDAAGADAVAPSDASALGTGASGYSAYQATSAANSALASQCNTGNNRATADACNDLGVMIEKGDGGAAPDYVVATILYEKACFYGSVVGCANAGTRLTDTTGSVTPNWDRAQTYLNAACNGGDGIGCEKLGWLHENRIAPDTGAALAAYSKACTLGIATACTSRDRLSPGAM
ncbi:tetratricopeptide repeat protein [Sphingopyxis sp. PET50]|uniref:tetratricopeptide repeat protein n=1 Tax=Sphingopyxis sp. PET50 TaxID=2976533 RepID=UPI0021AF65DF|nr:tetratricopeptide repeat protein [Sphingopyxis sp. PET50]